MDWGAILNNTAGWIFSPTTIAYALAATGLAVHFGFAGLLNFGMAGFMALGAYGYAMSILLFNMPWWFGILIGLVLAAIFAVILGVPTLRLRADYLAIVTIAAAEIVRLLFQTNTFGEYTGAARGLVGYHDSFRSSNPFPSGSYGFGPWTYNETQLWTRVFSVILLALCIFVVWALMRSPWGRVLKGIREDEDAVRSLGKNVFAYKMQALIIGGAMGALSGVVLALPSAVVPMSYTPPLTFFIWTILLLGGAATVFGPAVGALIFWVLMAFLDLVLPAMAAEGWLPITSIQAGTIRYILLGLALMALVIYRPQGIFGNKEEMTFVK